LFNALSAGAVLFIRSCFINGTSLEISRMPLSAVKITALLAGLTILPLCGQSSAWAATPDAGQVQANTVPAVDSAVLKHVDQRLIALKKSLVITPAQQADWHGFAAVMRSNATGLSRMYDERNAKLGTMNALANIESYAAITGRQADDMNALSAAFQILYGTLTPVQQHKADMVFRVKARQHERKRQS
jgi:hypothetical protein